MKLKNILGVCVASLALTLFAVPVMAASGFTYEVSAPIDLSTGNTVTEYKAGQLIALPINFHTPTDKIFTYSFIMDFDNTILNYGISQSELLPVSANARKLGKPQSSENNSNLCCVANAISSVDLFGDIEYKGNMATNDANNNGVVNVQWANSSEVDLGAEKPELYIFFKVLSDEFDDTKLNYSLVTVNDAECKISENSDENNIGMSGTTDPATKVNACDGAFQVVIDTTAASNSWIQELYVDNEDNQITYYVEDGDKVIFPVRVDSASTADKEITVYATTTPDEAGSGDKTKVELGKITLKLDGSVKSYDEYSATNNK